MDENKMKRMQARVDDPGVLKTHSKLNASSFHDYEHTHENNPTHSAKNGGDANHQKKVCIKKDERRNSNNDCSYNRSQFSMSESTGDDKSKTGKKKKPASTLVLPVSSDCIKLSTLEQHERVSASFLRDHCDFSVSRVLKEWPILQNPVPLDAEAGILPALLKSNHGMMCSQPRWRIEKVRKLCIEFGVDLSAALSLRRLHIKSQKPKWYTMERCGLGRQRDIDECAEIFEQDVESVLKSLDIPFLCEHFQKNHHKKHFPNFMTPPTPDFILQRTVFVDSIQIRWIEVKMFYGASTLVEQSLKTSAVGSLIHRAEKYVKFYGPGAFVFAYGCGMKVKEMLKQRHVIVLDPSLIPVERMRDHQKRWCANEDGEILP